MAKIGEAEIAAAARWMGENAEGWPEDRVRGGIAQALDFMVRRQGTTEGKAVYLSCETPAGQEMNLKIEPGRVTVSHPLGLEDDVVIFPLAGLPAPAEAAAAAEPPAQSSAGSFVLDPPPSPAPATAGP